ncbi:DeoR family transcriptional regulator [Anaerocolumna xylanovorans]|uniref:DeoR-like helix-turn-helix domain-containing protein n=1 Tax=Anaerocolumna xylanovorans DSM 12503 TaxID=1121345 RepID=A0A1M7YDE5_9FIRM|nr:DeoR family transcriptional regulator [Anaerocolumna xylanovorans]SHO50596.1 DeoR-like helix-turn-helix domain-containing protein [Anaerocolumna xylanovorans DSM 12503]
MLTLERYSSILDILQKKSIVTVSELTDLLGASESTIRRDLISLDEMGKLRKVHGGATLLEQEYITSEADVPTKTLLNVEEKMAIARYAAGTI